MALLTANDLPVVEARISMPRTGGAWTADLLVDGTDIDEGEGVTISIRDGALSLKGTAYRGGAYLDAGWIRVVGGKAGLVKIVTPKAYQRVELRVPLVDLLRAAGETLSETVSASLLQATLGYWTFPEAPAHSLLAALVAKAPAGTSWRFLADGTLWLGAETWPDSKITAFDELARDPRGQWVDLGVEAPLLLPGTTIGGERASYVEHHVHGAQVRTRVYLEGATALQRSPVGTVVDTVRRTFGYRVAGPVDLLACYRAKLAAQSSDLTKVDLVPDDTRLPGVGSVPLKLGLPGCTVQVSAGAYLLLGWEGGDPSKPYAVPCWEDGASVVNLTTTASTLYKIDGGAITLESDAAKNINITAGALATIFLNGNAVTGANPIARATVDTAGPYPIVGGNIYVKA